MLLPSKPTVLVDVDDVVVSFTRGFTAAVIATGVRDIDFDYPYSEWDLSKSLQLTKQEDDQIYALINMPGFASSLAPIPGAVENVKKLMTTCEVYFVTSPLDSSPTWAHDRQESLNSLFGKEHARVVSTHFKATVGGDILVDDKPDNTAAWADAHPGGTAVLWLTGRNSKSVYKPNVLRTNNWQSVHDAAARYAKVYALTSKLG